MKVGLCGIVQNDFVAFFTPSAGGRNRIIGIGSVTILEGMIIVNDQFNSGRIGGRYAIRSGYGPVVGKFEREQRKGECKKEY